MKYLGLFLCFIGIHKWKYLKDSKTFPNTYYCYCDRCGETTVIYDGGK